MKDPSRLNDTHPDWQAGRCNAKRKKHPDKLCKRYPLKGKFRCRRHGGSDLCGGKRAGAGRPRTGRKPKSNGYVKRVRMRVWADGTSSPRI